MGKFGESCMIHQTKLLLIIVGWIYLFAKLFLAKTFVRVTFPLYGSLIYKVRIYIHHTLVNILVLKSKLKYFYENTVFKGVCNNGLINGYLSFLWALNRVFLEALMH